MDIPEDEKKVCACDTASFTLTNSCGQAVTWEVVTNGVPDEPTVNGSLILAGTNCGTWLVIARSTTNPNCAESAGLTVYGVESLAPAGLTREGTNEPPTCITCPRATDAPDRWVRVTATSCPWVSEESSCTNLPPCWQITGGHRQVMVTNDCVNRLAVEVDLSQLGAHTVTASAGCSSRSVVILVQDTNRPTIGCSDLQFPTDPGKCFATVNLYDHISASDNCRVTNLTFNPDQLQFPKGTNTVTATATDIAGNTAHCTFNVVVYDAEDPTIVCPGDILVCADASGTNMVSWPTPTATDNCAVASVVCNPPSGSNFPVGETLVTCTATDSSGRQGHCTFWVRVVKLEVTNIKFNHNPNSSANDAINIRQDYNTAYDISSGEWVRGGQNLPVCYTMNKSVTIQVRLTVQPTSITNAEVWAVSNDSNGSLGDVVKRSVAFSRGISSPEYVTFTISGTTPGAIRKTTSDVWQWKMENINGSASAACNGNTSGPHTVYTILAEPVAPWSNTWGDPKNAWARALEFVIVAASCDGDSTGSAALAHIAQHLHSGHGLTYDIHGAGRNMPPATLVGPWI